MRRRAAVICAVALALAPVLSARAGSGAPDSFELSAVAVVARVSSTQQPAASVITAGLADATAGFASSALRDGGSAESLAAPLYPGDLVAGGPALLCQELISCPAAPPDYPLLADAAYPTHPDAHVGAGPMTARATASTLRTEATAQGAALAEVSPVSWRAASATTTAWLTAGAGHVVAKSVLHDVVIGPLRIALLESEDVVHLPVGERAIDHPSIRLAGVTLAGQSATVDETGVHVAGQHAGGTKQALALQGISVRLLGATQSDGVGAARSTGGALELVLTQAVSGAPSAPGLPSLDRVYVATVLLGGTGIAAAASDSDALVLSPPDLPGELGAVLSPRTAPRPAPASLGPAGAPTVDRQNGGPAPSLAVRLLAWDGFDLSSLALVLALLPTSLLLLWRTRAALRGGDR